MCTTLWADLVQTVCTWFRLANKKLRMSVACRGMHRPGKHKSSSYKCWFPLAPLINYHFVVLTSQLPPHQGELLFPFSCKRSRKSCSGRSADDVMDGKLSESLNKSGEKHAADRFNRSWRGHKQKTTAAPHSRFATGFHSTCHQYYC